MVKNSIKSKKTKSSNKTTKKEKDKDKEIDKIPVVSSYSKITTINSIHKDTLNFCFLSKTKKYILTCSSSYLLLLDSNNFKELSKYKMTKPPNYLVELSNNRILCANSTETFLFDVDINSQLILVFYYLENDFSSMGIIGVGEINNENIIVIIPGAIRYYKQSKEKNLELYDKFKFEDIIEMQYYDYGTQFKNAFIVQSNNDYIVLLTSEEIYIINHQIKILVKTITIEKSRVLLKYLNLTNEYTMIYHSQKLLLFSNKNLEIINNYLLSNKKEEIVCIQKLFDNNLLAFGTNLGKIYIYNFLETTIIREILFNDQIFKIYWIRELKNSLIVNNIPSNKISITNYNTGNNICELTLKKSSNYRRGVYIKETNKLLLGCANCFAILE